MGFRPGDKVGFTHDLGAPLGIGHVLEDLGVRNGVHMYLVALNPPESMPQRRVVPEDELRPLTDDEQRTL